MAIPLRQALRDGNTLQFANSQSVIGPRWTETFVDTEKQYG